GGTTVALNFVVEGNFATLDGRLDEAIAVAQRCVEVYEGTPAFGHGHAMIIGGRAWLYRGEPERMQEHVAAELFELLTLAHRGRDAEVHAFLETAVLARP